MYCFYIGSETYYARYHYENAYLLSNLEKDDAPTSKETTPVAQKVRHRLIKKRHRQTLRGPRNLFSVVQIRGAIQILKEKNKDLKDEFLESLINKDVYNSLKKGTFRATLNKFEDILIGTPLDNSLQPFLYTTKRSNDFSNKETEARKYKYRLGILKHEQEVQYKYSDYTQSPILEEYTRIYWERGGTKLIQQKAYKRLEELEPNVEHKDFITRIVNYQIYSSLNEGTYYDEYEHESLENILIGTPIDNSFQPFLHIRKKITDDESEESSSDSDSDSEDEREKYNYQYIIGKVSMTDNKVTLRLNYTKYAFESVLGDYSNLYSTKKERTLEHLNTWEKKTASITADTTLTFSGPSWKNDSIEKPLSLMKTPKEGITFILPKNGLNENKELKEAVEEIKKYRWLSIAILYDVYAGYQFKTKNEDAETYLNISENDNQFLSIPTTNTNILFFNEFSEIIHCLKPAPKKHTSASPKKKNADTSPQPPTDNEYKELLKKKYIFDWEKGEKNFDLLIKSLKQSGH